MPPLTVKQQLVQDRLGENLGQWLQRRRTEGTRWRDIERALLERTRIEVTEVTLRAWYPDIRDTPTTDTPRGGSQ
jgi:hypothetical protein